MKKILIICFITGLGSFPTFSQGLNFKSDIAKAKSSYASGNLEDAHFALQQSMQEIDIIVGKEVLKLLPQKMGELQAVAANDNVTGNVSFVGATIHRSYAQGDKKAQVEIINNSPLLGTLNTLLSSSLLAGLANDGKTKVLKVQGYKSRLTKEDNAEPGKTPYRLEIPFNNALVTFNIDSASENEVIAMANTIPFDQIAKLIQ